MNSQDTLMLSNRRLDRIEHMESMAFLVSLFLDNNQIARLENLGNCKRLKHLHLQNNIISSVDAKSLKCSFLQTLNLRNNRLRDLREVVQWLRNFKFIHYLDLAGNPAAEDVNYRSIVIAGLPSLIVLDDHAVTEEEREKAKAFSASPISSSAITGGGTGQQAQGNTLRPTAFGRSLQVSEGRKVWKPWMAPYTPADGAQIGPSGAGGQEGIANGGGPEKGTVGNQRGSSLGGRPVKVWRSVEDDLERQVSRIHRERAKEEVRRREKKESMLKETAQTRASQAVERYLEQKKKEVERADSVWRRYELEEDVIAVFADIMKTRQKTEEGGGTNNTSNSGATWEHGTLPVDQLPVFLSQVTCRSGLSTRLDSLLAQFQEVILTGRKRAEGGKGAAGVGISSHRGPLLSGLGNNNSKSKSKSSGSNSSSTQRSNSRNGNSKVKNNKKEGKNQPNSSNNGQQPNEAPFSLEEAVAAWKTVTCTNPLFLSFTELLSLLIDRCKWTPWDASKARSVAVALYEEGQICFKRGSAATGAQQQGLVESSTNKVPQSSSGLNRDSGNNTTAADGAQGKDGASIEDVQKALKLACLAGRVDPLLHIINKNPNKTGGSVFTQSRNKQYSTGQQACQVELDKLRREHASKHIFGRELEDMTLQREREANNAREVHVKWLEAMTLGSASSSGSAPCNTSKTKHRKNAEDGHPDNNVVVRKSQVYSVVEKAAKTHHALGLVHRPVMSWRAYNNLTFNRKSANDSTI